MALVDQRTNRRTSLLAGAALALVAIVGLAVVILGGGDKSNSRSPSGSSKGRPEQGASDRSVATLTAENAKFQEFFGVQLPTTSAGPRQTEGNRAIGFEHSPDGAVLAAIHILYRASASPGPAVFEPTIREQMVGSDRNAFLAKIQRDYGTAATAGTAPGGELAGAADQAKAIQSSVWAYRLDLYDPAGVSVQVLLRSVPSGSGPLFVNMGLSVKWVGGDWRLVAPLNGEFASVARQVPEVPAGYVVIGRV